jgi:hypothetical protein
MKESIEYQSEASTFTKKMTKTFKIKERSHRSTSISSNQILQELPEDGIPADRAIIQGFISETGPVRLAGGRSISLEVALTDSSGQIMQLVKESANEVARTEDYRFGRIFREATNTAYPIADGRPLLSTLHPMRIGGTQANTFTDNQRPFSYANLLEGIGYLQRMKDHAGNPIIRTGNYLILSSDDPITREAIWQVAGQMTPGKPGSDTNDMNYFKYKEGENYKAMSTFCLSLGAAQSVGDTFLTEADVAALKYAKSWYIIDMDYLMKINPLERVVFENGENKYKFEETDSRGMRSSIVHFVNFGVRASSYQWIFGSNGTGNETNF